MSDFKNIQQQLTNLVEEYYGTDHYGRILLQNPEEVNDEEGTVYTIRYNGGPGLIDDLYKARNGRYVWKNTGNGIKLNSEGGYKLFVTPDYRTAINVVTKYGGDIVKHNKNEFNESLLYESPMYQSKQKTFEDFYNYVINTPKCKKCYFDLNFPKLRIPSDTIIHSYKKHNTTVDEWLDCFDNFENIINAQISRKTLFSNPSKTYLLHIEGKEHYGIALQELNNLILTFFPDHANSIDNWIITDSARVPASQLQAPDTSKSSSVTISGQSPNDIITQIKNKIKCFNENYSIREIKDTIRDLFIRNPYNTTIDLRLIGEGLQQLPNDIELEYSDNNDWHFTRNIFVKKPTYWAYTYLVDGKRVRTNKLSNYQVAEHLKNYDGSIDNLIVRTNINEGEVVSLLDYKNKKALDSIPNDVIQDVDNYIEKNTWKINIEGVYIKSCETVEGITLFGNGETSSYMDFQNRVYSVDYALQKIEQTAKLDYTAYLTINGQKEQTEFNGRIYLGTDRYDVDLMELITDRTEKELAKRVEFINNPVKYNEASYEKDYIIFKQRFDKKRKQIEKQQPKETSDTSYIRDYTKDPQKVAVGDILVCSWGYSMSLVDYYRVTERKAKSIKLEKLQNKIISGGGYTGKCIPSNVVAEDKYQDKVKNKLFRIGTKWSKDVVCQINGHSVYFWDGKPDSYDHMD